MAKPTLLGKLLNKIRVERQLARDRTTKALYDRNKVPKNYPERDNYKIEESKIVTKDGVESVKFELWQRIDHEVVNITTEVLTKVIEEEKESEDWV